jgi:hypothetical protein
MCRLPSISKDKTTNITVRGIYLDATGYECRAGEMRNKNPELHHEIGDEMRSMNLEHHIGVVIQVAK